MCEEWISEISLLEDVVTKSPNKVRPHYNLGTEYYGKGRLDEAERESQAALRLNPYYADARRNLEILLAMARGKR